jgi:hypothetical protein
MADHSLRPELPPLPDRIAKLPVEARGYPVPFFVEWIDGVPDFRVVDGRKVARCVNEKRCWVCGGELGVHLAFLVGPMCAVNRISAEPPSHRECAEWSALACPFLSRPHMRRREGDLPDGAANPAGVMLKRNPGVTVLWMTKHYRVVRVPNGALFEMGEPHAIACFAQGRLATVDEVRASFDGGLPALVAAAEQEGRGAPRALEREVVVARKLLRIA